MSTHAGIPPGSAAGTRRATKDEMVPVAWANDAMLQTQYLGSLALSVASGAIRRLASVHPHTWGGCLASISRGEPRRLLDRAGVTALVFTAAELSQVTSVGGFSHVHVHSCADGANIYLFARLLFGLSYSLTLHGPLSDYGPNQREKWRHARFTIGITQRLLQEVQRELIGAQSE